ncbi:MAG: thymidylate synthase [Chloroflexi bacterium]|nr:thymidylate synthase [Chloroflexota bacterium]
MLIADSHIQAQTLDDLMRAVITQTFSEGIDIEPTKGPAKELNGILLELTHPRARLSRTETKGKPFSCLGELLWYLSQSRELAFISYYLPQYNHYAEDNSLYGAYGPRLFNWKGLNQVQQVLDLLKAKPDSRQAVIQLFDAADISEPHNDVPCTCTLQFMIRQGRLHLFTHMRSNDIMWGLPHDIFSFTMLQELFANDLQVELGTYKHMVGSLHLYRKSIKDAHKYLQEGWQSTSPMPTMPSAPFRRSIQEVIDAEQRIRNGHDYPVEELQALQPYWADLIRLLLVFRASKQGDCDTIKQLRNQMSSPHYNTFIDSRIKRLT